MDSFKPTHWIRIGTGKNRAYWKVKLVGPIGKEDKFYNAILSPRNRSGLHMVYTETRLRLIKK